MSRLFGTGLLGAALLLAGPALGFQETSVLPGTSPSSGPVAGIASSQDGASGTHSSETPVDLPGFDSLDVLPKLDFGLELLYGANEPTSAEDVGVGDADALTIQGRVKHRF